jgi:PPP family 3-phenylpropionic acid transporter
MRRAQGGSFAIRSAGFCATVFFGLGVYLPFFPLWLADQGLSDAEIGTIVAAPLLVRIAFTPALAGLADKLPTLGGASALYALLATMLVALLAVVSGYWPILLLTALALLFWYALLPLCDAVILAGVREHGIDYGRTRLWGSIGFIAATFLTAAAIDHFSAGAMLGVLFAAFVVGSVVGILLPHVTTPPRIGDHYGLRRALKEPILARQLIAGNLVLAGHGAYYAFGSLYWNAQGFSEGLIGALWAFSVVAEIGLFWAARFLPILDARTFIVAGAVGALVRWGLFPFATTPAAALLLQGFHATTFALTHLGIMAAIGAVALPGHTARLQAVHQLIGGIMLAAVTSAAGPLFRISPVLTFWAMALLAIPALFLVHQLWRAAQPQRSACGGSTVAPE